MHYTIYCLRYLPAPIRDAKVQRFNAKIIAPLSQYATICKHARDDVKNTFAVRDKELTRRRHLDRLRERNPRNRQMIVSLLNVEFMS